MTHAPRKTPCATCPYRKNAPSGLWHPDEYKKLPDYDKPMDQQPMAVFLCHQANGKPDLQDADICSGWLGYKDPNDLLAVRMGVAFGRVTPEAMNYVTTVKLFDSGQEAAVHGLRDVVTPSTRAHKAIDKLMKLKGEGNDDVDAVYAEDFDRDFIIADMKDMSGENDDDDRS